jgi:hypothetical protein
MNWFNLYTPFVRSPMFIGSEPIIRSTWLSLICYCCEQENGGLILNCEKWKDRQWQQTCGVTLEETRMESALWKWHNGSITVEAYPFKKQAEVVAKRLAGKKGGKASGFTRKKAANEAQLRSSASSTASKQSLNGRRRGRGMEGNNTLSASHPSSAEKNEPLRSKEVLE